VLIIVKLGPLYRWWYR